VARQRSWVAGRLASVLLCATVAGCSDESNHAAATAGADTLTGDTVAKVGSLRLDASLVASVASARDVSVRTATGGLVDDALLAARFTREHPNLAAGSERAALARRVEEEFMRAARAGGKATAAELEKFTQRHWWEIDRPATAQVYHAVVVCEEGCPNERAASELADAIASATEGETDAEGFEAAARAVPTRGIEVKIEKLSPVAADGRIVKDDTTPGPDNEFGRYHEQFAKAANAIPDVGSQGRVRSPSGFHVMLLVAREPGRRLTAERRAELLLPEIHASRARQLQDAVLQRMRTELQIEVSRSFSRDTERLLGGP